MSYIVPRRVRSRMPGPYRGQVGEVTTIYRDIYRRGGEGPDFYFVLLDTGRQISGLSHHFDHVEPGILVIEPDDLEPPPGGPGL